MNYSSQANYWINRVTRLNTLSHRVTMRPGVRDWWKHPITAIDQGLLNKVLSILNCEFLSPSAPGCDLKTTSHREMWVPKQKLRRLKRKRTQKRQTAQKRIVETMKMRRSPSLRSRYKLPDFWSHRFGQAMVCSVSWTQQAQASSVYIILSFGGSSLLPFLLWARSGACF